MSRINCCGSVCSECSCYKNVCKGCNEMYGKVFFCENGKTCAIFQCCVENHKFKSCAECADVPCELWQKTRDPKFNDEEFEQNIANRQKNLQRN